MFIQREIQQEKVSRHLLSYVFKVGSVLFHLHDERPFAQKGEFLEIVLYDGSNPREEKIIWR